MGKISSNVDAAPCHSRACIVIQAEQTKHVIAHGSIILTVQVTVEHSNGVSTSVSLAPSLLQPSSSLRYNIITDCV